MQYTSSEGKDNDKGSPINVREKKKRIKIHEDGSSMATIKEEVHLNFAKLVRKRFYNRSTEGIDSYVSSIV